MKRYVDTKFWTDSFVVDLDYEAKSLFMYFLTNPHTNLIGIYELPLPIIAMETGLDINKIKETMTTLDGRVSYCDGWVFVRNFIKHQSSSPQLHKGMERELALVPSVVLKKAGQIMTKYGMDISSIPSTQGSIYLTILNHTGPNPTKPNLDSTQPSRMDDNLGEGGENEDQSTEENTQTSAGAAKTKSDLVFQIFSIFKEINPMVNSDDRTMSKDAQEMIDKLGSDLAIQSAEYAASIFGKQYAPTITDPSQLREKYASLIAYQERSKKKNSGGLGIAGGITII